MVLNEGSTERQGRLTTSELSKQFLCCKNLLAVLSISMADSREVLKALNRIQVIFAGSGSACTYPPADSHSRSFAQTSMKLTFPRKVE